MKTSPSPDSCHSAALLRSFCRLWQNLSPEDLHRIALLVHQPQYYHTEALADALGISRTQFYRLKRRNLIPPPMKIPGLKEKLYTSFQLEQIKKQLATLQ